MNFFKNRNNINRLTGLKNEFVVMGAGKEGLIGSLILTCTHCYIYIYMCVCVCSFFYFWLCWVLIAVYKLSLVVVGRGYSLVAA